MQKSAKMAFSDWFQHSMQRWKLRQRQLSELPNNTTERGREFWSKARSLLYYQQHSFTQIACLVALISMLAVFTSVPIWFLAGGLLRCQALISLSVWALAAPLWCSCLLMNLGMQQKMAQMLGRTITYSGLTHLGEQDEVPSFGSGLWGHLRGEQMDVCL